MIRIDFGPRFGRSLRKIRPDLTAEAERRLSQIAKNFSQSHKHGGLGLRKLQSNAYEARLGLHYRLILIHRQDCLEAFDIMTHEEVRRWLRAL